MFLLTRCLRANICLILLWGIFSSSLNLVSHWTWNYKTEVVSALHKMGSLILILRINNFILYNYDHVSFSLLGWYGYDTKLCLMMRILFWSSGKCGESLYCHYSQVHSDPQLLYYLLDIYSTVITNFGQCGTRPDSQQQVLTTGGGQCGRYQGSSWESL